MTAISETVSGPLSAACDALQEARDRADEWAGNLENTRAALTEVESTMGVDALTGDAGQVATRLAEARAAVDVTAAALRGTLDEVDQARRTVVATRVAELREQARALTAEADQRQARTRALLEQLREWEDGADYVLAEPWMAEIRGASREVCRIPKTTRLRNQAAGLEASASKLEQQAAAAGSEQLTALAARITTARSPDADSDAPPTAA